MNIEFTKLNDSKYFTAYGSNSDYDSYVPLEALDKFVDLGLPILSVLPTTNKELVVVVDKRVSVDDPSYKDVTLNCPDSFEVEVEDCNAY